MKHSTRIRLNGAALVVVATVVWTVLAASCLIFGERSAWAKDLIVGERLKLTPEVVVRETYDDNVYLTDSDEVDDFITTVFPSLDAQFAFSPRARLGLLYSGAFDFYADADNFREGNNYGNLRFEYDTPKGSSIELGTWGLDSSIQPYAVNDRYKPYDIWALYADVNYVFSEITEFFGNVHHSVRRFDDTRDIDDDYERDFFAVGMVNARASLFPWLLEYRYETQVNDQVPNVRTELDAQSAYTGFKWGQDRRLSGTLRVGYLWSDYNDAKAYDGWATDTELDYRIGGFTTLGLIARRGVRESTLADRDTLDYYIYEGAGLSLSYTRLDPIDLYLTGGYENRDYRSTTPVAADREDDYYIASLTASYRLTDLVSFSLGYVYRKNNSTQQALYGYTDNRVLAEITLFSGGELRRRRLPEDPDRIRFF